MAVRKVPVWYITESGEIKNRIVLSEILCTGELSEDLIGVACVSEIG